MIWQLHNLSHKLPEELKLNQGSTFRANLYWHRFTASSEATAINTYWVYALRFTKCLFFFVLLILKQTIKPAGLFYLLLLFLSTKIAALAKNIGGFHMNTSLLTFSFSIHPLEEPSAAPSPQRQSQQMDQCDIFYYSLWSQTCPATARATGDSSQPGAVGIGNLQLHGNHSVKMNRFCKALLTTHYPHCSDSKRPYSSGAGCSTPSL